MTGMLSMLTRLDKVVITLKIRGKNNACVVKIGPEHALSVLGDRYGIRFMGLVAGVHDDFVELKCDALSKQADRLHGYQVEVSFNFKDGSYYFNSAIMGHSEKGNLLITAPPQINRTQRRNDVRLFQRVPVTITRIDGRATANDGVSFPVLAAKDVSAGGVRLESSSAVLADASSGEAKDSGLTVEFTLPRSNRIITAETEVMWITRVGNQHELGVRFTDIPKLDQQFIVQYIYLEQIREKKEQSGQELRRTG
jgi:c-di-GMP-binding flagellar brake protein YcgR